MPEDISGAIERVTYFNEENGFAVLQVQVPGRRDLSTVVGTLPSVCAGEWVNGQGNWVRDRERGLQFRATMLIATPPTTLEGIEKYLGSGMVKGIGPVYAKKLVHKFGAKVLEVIEKTSGRLEEVEGIGPKRRLRIKEAWAEQKTVREIMVFLHSHGVGTSRAARIHKVYGEDAIKRVRENPFILARDIQGVGFRTADQIARTLGIPADSLARITAGVQHILQEAAGDGHCALPLEELITHAGELLGVTPELVGQAVVRSQADGSLVLEMVDGTQLAFLPYLQRAEANLASRLWDLVAAGPPAYPPIDVERAITWCQEKTGKQLAASQIEAVRMALRSRVLVVTGGPGVGKTTLVNSILLILRAKKLRCLLCAPTGRAAKKLTESTGLPATTIHRMLEVRGVGQFGRDAGNPLQCDLLVMDETSMVDVPLLNAVLKALPRNASLVLVGDVDQLPSVGPGSVLQDIIHWGSVPVARLTEVFRQASGSKIITNAHRINQGLMPEPEDGEGQNLTDFYFIEREDPERILQTLTEMVRNRIPAKFGVDPLRDIQVLSPMNRGSLGIRELNVLLQSHLNPPKPGGPFVEKFGWQFRPGDKVMQTENDYDKEVFNGDIGIVAAVDREDQSMTVRFDQRDVIYGFSELDALSLAYAITVHKSQGSEFPVVVLPLATQQYLLLQRNLVYTAVTRGRKLVVIVGQRRALGMAVRNHATKQRFSGLLARLKALEST